jgi:Tfp pilus assembly protein PilF/peroxiredoxin
MSQLTGGRKIVIRSIIPIILVASLFAHSADAQALLQAGAQAPEFSLKDLEGNKVSLSDFSGKKAVVLVFWSTWSANSPRALQRFEDFFKKYKDKGIQVAGINAESQTLSGEDLEKIKKTVKDLGISFPMLLDKNLTTFRAYGVIALPSTMVITEGKMMYELPGFPLVGTEELFDYLLVLSGEQPRKKTEQQYKPRHDAVADTGLGRGFVKKKMNAMAYPYFKKSIEKDPRYMLPYVELAKLYQLDGDNAGAEEVLRKALSVEPGNVVVASELGHFLTKTGKVKEGLEILSRAATINSYTPAHYYYAYALGKNGRIKEALAAFDASLSLNPFEATAYQLRAEIYEDNKMLKEASSDYRKALELLLKIKE